MPLKCFSLATPPPIAYKYNKNKNLIFWYKPLELPTWYLTFVIIVLSRQVCMKDNFEFIEDGQRHYIYMS